MASGIGVGPELMEVVKRVFQVANAPVVFEELPMGPEADERDMDNLIYSVERNGVAIKGNIEKALEPQEMSRNMQLRRALDLFVNLIEIKSFPGITEKTRMKGDVDLVLVRQNTEGEFAMLEHENGSGIEHLKITTVYETERLAEFAFKYAIENKRRRIVVPFRRNLHKSEDLFTDMVSEVSKKYPEMPLKIMPTRVFVSTLSEFNFNGDVLVTGVLTGGIIMNLLFGMSKGTGLYCGQNYGHRYAVFEPAARNKGYKLAGKNLANPVVALMCGISMLRHLGLQDSANIIQRAVELTVNEDKVLPHDVMGDATTSQMVDNIERRIREVMPEGYNLAEYPPLPPIPPFIEPFKPQ